MGRERVVEYLSGLAKIEHDALLKSKCDSVRFGEHSDWPWNGLVLSAATRGGSWRWERNVQPRYETELSWAILSQTTAEERRKRLETVGRFWQRTANWLEAAYDRVAHEGGPTGVRSKLDRMTADEVIAFWKSLNNIKDKFARNIMMDIYHPNFRKNFFAIDSRLIGLLPLLTYDGSRAYSQREAFLCQLAADVGIDAWDLDRLLYAKHKEISASLRGSA